MLFLYFYLLKECREHFATDNLSPDPIPELGAKNLALSRMEGELASLKERTAELMETIRVLEATRDDLILENRRLREEKNYVSPYQVGGSLPLDSLSYVVRQADRDLYRGLKGGDFCYVFNSRQMGKSSLRVRMMKTLQGEGIRGVSIDLSPLGSQQVTAEQWYFSFIYQLAKELHLLPRFDIRRWWRDNRDLSPVFRLWEFIELILKEIDGSIIIYLDEIDSLMNLSFSSDDFFLLLQSLYHQRSLNPELRRLTIALFGVMIPRFLNVGRTIDLEGFKAHEAQSLLWGWQNRIRNPRLVLKRVLEWTNGQPFLTQKICQLIHRHAFYGVNDELVWVDSLIRTRVIQNWEFQDSPEHLKTIASYLLYNPRRPPSRLLEFYRTLLLAGSLRFTGSDDESELLLSGLTVRDGVTLKVKNPIYEAVFNAEWVGKHLK